MHEAKILYKGFAEFLPLQYLTLSLVEGGTETKY